MLRTERAEAWLLSGQFSEAQKDCKEVIVAQPENVTAWVVRAEILVATDKAEQAIKELEQIEKLGARIIQRLAKATEESILSFVY